MNYDSHPTLQGRVWLSVCLFVCLSVSPSLTHTHTHYHSLTHQSPSLAPSLPVCLSFPLPPSGKPCHAMPPSTFFPAIHSRQRHASRLQLAPAMVPPAQPLGLVQGQWSAVGKGTYTSGLAN